MPKLFNPSTNDTCFFCGAQALFVSVNSKQLRCLEKVTQCPGFINKAEESRQRKMTAEQRRSHMKKMSEKGHAVLKELHRDNNWVATKGSKISASIKDRGGHSGTNNPMCGKSHSTETKQKLSEKANKRNSACYINATETKISRGIAIPKEQKKHWELYKEQVLNHTYKSWKHHQDKINPCGLERGKEYELDHKFSITEGFKQGVNPIIIGHLANLELIPKSANRSKRIQCSITLEDLQQEYNRWNAQNNC
jgi:hypothetical protein